MFLENMEDNIEALILFCNTYGLPHNFPSISKMDDLSTAHSLYHVLCSSSECLSVPPGLEPLSESASDDEKLQYLESIIKLTLDRYAATTELTLPDEMIPVAERLLPPNVTLNDVICFSGLVLTLGILGDHREALLATIFELTEAQQHYVMLSVAPFLPQVIEEQEEMKEDIQLAEISFTTPPHVIPAINEDEETHGNVSDHSSTTDHKPTHHAHRDSTVSSDMMTPTHTRKRSMISPFATLLTPLNISITNPVGSANNSPRLAQSLSIVRRNSVGHGLLSPKTLLNNSYARSDYSAGMNRMTSFSPSPRNLSTLMNSELRQTPKGRKSFFGGSASNSAYEDLQKDYESVLLDRHRCEQECEKLQMQLKDLKKQHEKQLYDWTAERDEMIRQYSQEKQDMQTQISDHFAEERAQARQEYLDMKTELERQIRDLKQTLASHQEQFSSQISEYERVLGVSHQEMERLRDVVNTYSEKLKACSTMEAQLNKFLSVGLEADVIRTKLQETEVELSIAREEIRQMQTRLTNKVDADVAAEKEQDKVPELESKLQEIQIKYDYSERATKTLQDQLEEMTGEKQLLLDKIETLSHKLEMTKATTNDKLVVLEKEKLKSEQLRNQLSLQRDEEKKAFEDQINAKDREISDLSKQIDSLNTMQSNMSREMDGLRAQVADMAKMKTEVAEIEDLREQINEMKEKDQQYKDMELSYQELRVKCEDLEMDFDAQRQSMEVQLEGLRHDIETEKRKSEEYIQANTTLMKEKMELNEACQRKDEYISELEGLLKDEETEKDKQILELRQNKEDLFGLVTSKDIELEYQADIISQRDTALNAKTEECASLSSKNSDLEKEIVSLRENLQTTQQLIASLQEETRENGDNNAKITELTIELSQTKSKLSTVNALLEAEVKEKSQTEQKYAQLEEKIVQMSQERVVADTASQALQESLVAAQHQAAEAQETVTSRATEVESLKQHVSSQDQEIAELKRLLHELQLSQSSANVANSETTAELAALREKNTALEQELTTLRTKLDEEVKLKTKFEKYVVQVSRDMRGVDENAKRVTQQNTKLLENLKQARADRDELEMQLYERERVLKQYSLVVKREQKLLASAFYEIGSEFHRYLADQRLQARLEGELSKNGVSNVSAAYQSWIAKQKASLQQQYM